MTFDKSQTKTGLEEKKDKEDTELEDKIEEEEGESVKDDKPSPRRDRLDELKAIKSGAKTDVCPLYKKRQCPHGPSGQDEIEGKVCQFTHPRKCLKFCRFGKRKGGCRYKGQLAQVLSSGTMQILCQK